MAFMTTGFQKKTVTTKTRWWRRLSVLLIVSGLLLASAPLMQRGYADWSQSQLEQRFINAAEAESSPGGEPSQDPGSETLPLMQGRWNNAVALALDLQQSLTSADRLPWPLAENPVLEPPQTDIDDIPREPAAAGADTVDEIVTQAAAEDKVDSASSLARIRLPSIGVEAVVLQGTGPSTLAKGPGFYDQASLPGQPGNVAIAGHRTTYGAWFRHVDRLQDGDIIEVDYEGVTYRYRVERVWVIESNDWSVIAPTEAPSLTLTTCHPPGSTAFRLAVRATLFETVS